MAERPATWEDVIRHEAKQARVPAELALAIADTESGFDPAAVSKKGARGFFQLMPETAAELGVDPNDPVQNIRGGLKYFRQQLDAFGGSVEKALQAYNWGPGNVSGGGEPPEETRNYVTRILGRLGGSQTAGQASPTPSAGEPIRPLPVLTAQQVNRQIGQPPPGGPPTRERSREAVGEPPPSSFAADLVAGVSPRTATGRRSLLGTAGGAAGTAIGSVLGPIGAIAGGVAGAGLGGAASQALEQVVPPPVGPGESVVNDQPSILGAGAEQAAYETLGQAFAWPVKAAGKRLLAAPVVQQASKHFEELLTTARGAVTSAREAAAGAVSTAREAGAVLKEAAGERAAKLKAATVQGGQEAVRKATEFGEQAVEAATAPYNAIATAPPVSPSVAGRRATEVIRGPARSAREEIGQMVEQAAKEGPDVDIRALKEEAQRIISEELRPSAQAFPAPGRAAQALSPAEQTIQDLQPLMANFTPERVASLTGPQKAQYEAMQKAMSEAQDAYRQEILKHPAMQVLGRIISAEDTVPFEAAHLFKRELDDAIGTAWDRSVRNRVTNITKVMRGTLREALGGFAPYDAATKAYQSIAPLYTKGIAPKLLKVAEESPEAIVRLIKGNDPTSARMLRELLVTQPGQVGEGKAGQYAWDSVRSAWTQEKLIKGGIAGFDNRLAKLDPELVDVMYGDGPGKLVLDNLRQISAAVKSAGERAAAGVTETKAVAQGAEEAAAATGRSMKQEASRVARAQTRQIRREGRRLVGGAVSDLAAQRHEARQFALSSLVRAGRNDALVDVLRAGVQGPMSTFGSISIVRLLRGVKGDELIKYASHSTPATQALVQLITGPAPEAAAAALVRLLGGVLGVGEITRSGIGTPPPAPPASEPTASPLAGLVGAPPP